ncbi:MAG: endo-1,4-beta-xylanase [Bacteroidaceae bacterium]|nr:endo-1,4-beta-xylanase [Bacteroidaceae bacterium]
MLVRLVSVLLMLFAGSASAKAQQTASLKEAFKNDFLIGTALNMWQVRHGSEQTKELIRSQFSTVVAENCMKSEVLQPVENVFNFKDADEFISLAENNGQVVTGHCLVWHSQAPAWFFHNDKGVLVDRQTMIERMRKHIYTVMGHFKGRVKGWDVVNEAIEFDGSLRKSNFYNIIGEDYIRLAFQFAHEADPDAELYYNDYSMDNPNKREAVVKLIRDLKAHGLRIDAVGMQSHLSTTSNLKEYEESMEAFIKEGVKVMATELDVSVLPFPNHQMTAEISTNFEYQEALNPYKKGITEEKQAEQNDFMVKLFKIYKKHAKDITRITFWGVTDGDSWKNDFPVPGRTDYPLPFGRDLKPKPWVYLIIK